MATIKHWVNLRRDNKDNYVGTQDITSEEQLEYRLFECEFKKARASKFKVKVEPISGKVVTYQADEERRNPNFKLRPGGINISSGSKKKKKLSKQIYFPPAGGSQYKISAKYRKAVVESKKYLEIWRRIYFQIISMRNVPLAGLSDFKNEFKKYHIDMKEMAASAGKNKMTVVDTIYDHADNRRPSSNESNVLADASSYYKIRDWEPNAAAAVFVKSIATYAELDLKSSIASLPSRLGRFLGADVKEYTIDVKDSTGDQYLWKDLLPQHDTAKFWMVGNATFINEKNERYPISRDAVEIDESISYRTVGARNYGFSRLKVRVDKKKDANIFTKEKGHVELKVRIVSGFSGGYSKPDKNVVLVATRAWWDPNDNTTDELNYILNHEMGHKIGMVAAGDSPPPGGTFYAWIDTKAPNAPPNIYGQYYNGPLANNQGHQGPHCSKDATYTSSTNRWSGAPGCVMFGATSSADYDSSGNVTAYHPSPPQFCSDCGEVVKKLELDGETLDGMKNRFF